MPIAEFTAKVVNEGVKAVDKVVEAAEKVENIAAKIKELGSKDSEIVRSKIEEIVSMKPEQLEEYANKVLEQAKQMQIEATDKRTEKTDSTSELESDPEKQSSEGKEVKEGLTDEQKQKIKEETGWSDEIIDYIRSMEEYRIYKEAGLVEAEIGDRKCLIRHDIDWDRKYETGKYDENGNVKYETNRDRIASGRAPLDENGRPIQLHHIGQHVDSPLAELTFQEHRCNGNDTILHDKTIETETHGEGNNWDSEREEYWKNRAEYNEGAG